MTKIISVISGLALVAHAAFIHSPSIATANIRVLLAVAFIVCLARATSAIVRDFVEA